jgi:hypothetical protein
MKLRLESPYHVALLFYNFTTLYLKLLFINFPDKWQFKFDIFLLKKPNVMLYGLTI